MMRKFLAIALVLTVSPAFLSGETVRYRSDKLEKMATALSCTSSLAALSDGEFVDFFHF